MADVKDLVGGGGGCMQTLTLTMAVYLYSTFPNKIKDKEFQQQFLM